MSVEELKSRIYEGVLNIDDEDFLLALEETINKKYIPSDEIILTEAEKKALDRAHDQIQRGEFLTNEQSHEIVERWLRE